MRQLIYLAIVLCFSVQHISAQCCDFNNNDCGYNLGYWQWSLVSPPPANAPVSFTSHGTDYIWVEPTTGTAQASSYDISVASSATYISFDYYYSNSNFGTGSYLHIYFVPDGSSYRFPLLETSIPGNTWIHQRIPCNYGTSYCCGLPGTSCTGKIEIIANLDEPYYDALYGVDNIGTCDAAPVSCCTIANTLSCGFDNSVLNDYYWQNYLVAYPVNPPPMPPSGAYSYFEVANNIALDVISSDYVSDQIAIPASINFQINVYVQSTNVNNALQVGFRESTTGLTTKLLSVPTTYGQWLDISFQCGGTEYDCCLSQSSCSGSIILTGHVEGLGETVLYAVNRIGQVPC